MASGWCTVPLRNTAAQVVQTPAVQELGRGTPAASAAARTVWSARQGNWYGWPLSSTRIWKLWGSDTGEDREADREADGKGDARLALAPIFSDGLPGSRRSGWERAANAKRWREKTRERNNKSPQLIPAIGIADHTCDRC
jgi:hypothetical protein